jgi:lipopolysaccharide biosynthesis glycosyltransferase
MNELQVACCFDDAMALPACVVAASVAAKTTDARVTFHMLHAPALSIDLTDLQRALESDRFRILTRPITDDLSDLYKTKQYSEAMYFRYLLPYLLDCPRVIYLDCDVTVRKSLTELFETDLQGYSVAAAVDHGLSYHMRDHGIPLVYRGRYMSVEDYFGKELGFDVNSTPYFNSGVLVMDLDEWRRKNLSERLMDYCREHVGLVMADQDAGNVILNGDFAKLDTRWNAHTYLYREYVPIPGERKTLMYGGFEKRFRPPTGEWLEILEKWAFDPWIVHSSFRSKPWEAHHRRTPYDAEFWENAARTPYLGRLQARFEASKKIPLATRIAQRYSLRAVRATVRRVQHLLRTGG